MPLVENARLNLRFVTEIRDRNLVYEMSAKRGDLLSFENWERRVELRSFLQRANLCDCPTEHFFGLPEIEVCLKIEPGRSTAAKRLG